MSSAQHDLRQSRDWRFWSIDHGQTGEMCERFYISNCFEGNLKVNTANNLIALLFYILTQASHIFFRLLLNLIFNLIYS